MLPAVALRAVRDLGDFAQIPALRATVSGAAIILEELQGVRGSDEARDALSQLLAEAVLAIHEQFTDFHGDDPIDIPDEVLSGIAALNDSLARTHESLRRQQTRRGGPLTKVLHSGLVAEMLKTARQDIQRGIELYKLQANLFMTRASHALMSPLTVRANRLATVSLPIDRPPRPPLLIGRDDELLRVVAALTLSSSNHVAIMGAPGIGKTTLALSVLHHEDTVKQFEQRRFYIACAAHRSVPLLLASLGMNNVRELVAFLQGSQPSLLLLDNFDVTFVGEHTAADALINTLGAVDNLMLLMTMRGAELGGLSVRVERYVLGPLTLHASEELFLKLTKHYPFDSPLVRFSAASSLSSPTHVSTTAASTPTSSTALDGVHQIIAEADGMPLALTLLARRPPGNHGPSWSFISLTLREQEQDELGAVIASSVTHIDPSGAETLALLARAPSGLRRSLLPAHGVSVLLRAALAYRRSSHRVEEEEEERIYVLAPIRQYALTQLNLSQSGLAYLRQVQSDEPTLPLMLDPPNFDLSSVTTLYTARCEFLKQSMQSVATTCWSDDPTVTTFYTARSDLWGQSAPSVATTFWSVRDIAVAPEIEDAEHLRDYFKQLDVTHEIRSVSQRPHGFGGTSDVMKAERHNIAVAVKVHRVVRPPADASLLSRIAREIALWRTLSHPNILPLTGLYWGETDLPGLVSPWCSKGHLTSYLASLRAFPISDHYTMTLMEMLEGSLSGLAYLHSIGTVHGDLKGTNIMVTDDGVACIVDFGVSAVLTEYPPRSAEGAGTFRWMAPELLEPRPILTWASDIWAYGCVIIEVVTGERPFHDLAEEVQVILALDKGATPPRPSGIPDELWELCEQCFTLASVCRPRAEQLLADLQGLID